MKSTILTILFACACSCAFAAVYTLNDDVTGKIDWTDAANYNGGSVPTGAADDEIYVPAGVNVTISDTSTDDSLALFQTIKAIRPQADDSVITFDVAEGKTVVMNCGISKLGTDASNVGEIVKNGKGTVEFNSFLKFSSYASDYTVKQITINEGVIKCKQDVATANRIQAIYNLHIAEGAYFYPFAPQTEVKFYSNKLTGTGTITNEVPYNSTSTDFKNMYFAYVGEEPMLVELAIRAQYQYLVSGNVHFSNVNNTGGTTSFSSSPDDEYNLSDGDHKYRNRVEVMCLGDKGNYTFAGQLPSSIGSHQINFYPYGGCLVYCGNGEESSKTFAVQGGATSTARFELNGGEHGGLVLTGDFGQHVKATVAPHAFYLTGENVENACVMQGKIQRFYMSLKEVNFNFIKQGSGIWRFADIDSMDTYRTFGGLIAVQEGTLQFDSIAAKGKACSIGTANAPYPSDYYSDVEVDTADKSPYAFELGGTTTRGTFEYLGTSEATCTNRLIAMTGEGAIKSSAGALNIGGVRTKSSGEYTLVLDGDGTDSINTICDIEDGSDGAHSNDGKISLVKEGTRKWLLKDDSNLHGSICVKEGTLEIGARYSWYKWLIKSNVWELDPGTHITICAAEIGLYAADGTRQNLNMLPGRLSTATETTSANMYPNLKPNYIDYGFTQAEAFSADTRSGNYYNPALLTDASNSAGHGLSFWYNTKADKEAYANRNVHHCYPNQETTWLPIVMHLKADAEPIRYWDYANSSSGNDNTYRSLLYASVDGVNWDVVSPETCRKPYAGWQLAQRAVVQGDDNCHTNIAGQVDGEAISPYPAINATIKLENVKSIQVDEGAKLVFNADISVSSLTIDAQKGAGTIEGGKYAENGQVILTNYANEDVVDLPDGTCEGLANIANWACCRADGKVMQRTIRVIDGKLRIFKSCSLIVVR